MTIHFKEIGDQTKLLRAGDLARVDVELVAEALEAYAIQLNGIVSLNEPVISNSNDYYLWALQQAGLLSSGQFERLDIENVVDEVADLARREKRNLYSAIKAVVYALIMLKEAPGAENSTEWRSELSLQRSNIESIIEDSPSLETELPSMIAKGWLTATKMAAHELLGLGIDAAVPDACLWAVAQVLDYDFMPMP